VAIIRAAAAAVRNLDKKELRAVTAIGRRTDARDIAEAFSSKNRE
jgi:hypothetical protein